MSSPKLPPLPKGWVWSRVRDVGEVRLGRQRSPKDHAGKYMRPYLRVANVFEARIDTSDVNEMNFTPEEFETYKLEPGDILLNEGQSHHLVGRPAIYRGEVPGACFQNTLVRFRVHDGLRPEFALLVFRHYLHSKRFQKLARWTTNIAHLGSDRFAEVEFPLPPGGEQHRIVEEADKHFTRLDAGVEALKRVQLHFKRYRASVLKAACEGRLVPTEAALAKAEGRSYEPASLLVKGILEQRRVLKNLEASTRRSDDPMAADPMESRDLPEGWAWATVDQLALAVQYGSSSKTSEEVAGVPVLRMGNILDGRLSLEELKYLPSSHAEFPELLLESGDILFNRTNSPELVGKVAVYRGSPNLLRYY